MIISGEETSKWVERMDALFFEIRQQEEVPLLQLRATLFDARATTAQKERALIALIHHSDARALNLLTHQALSFSHPRLRFVHTLAVKRRRALGDESTKENVVECA